MEEKYIDYRQSQIIEALFPDLGKASELWKETTGWDAYSIRNFINSTDSLRDGEQQLNV